MKKTIFLSALLATLAVLCSCGGRPRTAVRTGIPLDSIRLSDPAILADSATMTYYMTGTSGLLWKSRDLRLWEGPYAAAETTASTWMGETPEIWAAELHAFGRRYYYFATFTNTKLKIRSCSGATLDRRACHVLVSDNPEGPYRPFGDAEYLPAGKSTLDGTLWVDTDGKPYLVYCHEWVQNGDGTIECVEMKPDLSGTVGEPRLLFRASSSPWSREEGSDSPNRVTDGPWLFRTGTGRLGMLWTSWIGDVYTQGAAYSESGTLAGPWIHEPQPVTPPNFGHGMLFRTLDGRWLMSVHSHRKCPDGHFHRVPHLFEADLSGDRLAIGEEYRPM